MLRRIASFSAGRRTKWVVLVAWVVLAVVFGRLQPKLQDAIVNEPEAFLPESAGSTEALKVLKDRFPEGRDVPAVVTYGRRGGLTANDRRAIVGDAIAISRRGVLKDAAAPIVPIARNGRIRPGAVREGLVSKSGAAVTVIVPMDPENDDVLRENVDEIRRQIDTHGEGLQAHVTGPAGVTADSVEIFNSIDRTLLLATVSLVLVLLLLVHRSPIIALVPLLVVGAAYSVAAGVVFLLVEAGTFDVNGGTTAMLIVLMFGAGTDYSLLIVNRYKEELRGRGDRHDAMVHAAERTGPAILAAGGTVVAAMSVLVVADLQSTKSMGPVLALGIAIMIATGLTLLPALLTILGRRAFWPSIPRLGVEPRRLFSIWGRIGHLVRDRPLPAMTVTVLALGAGALGNLTPMDTLDFGEGFREETDSIRGTRLVEENFPAGQAVTTDVIVGRRAAGRVTAALAGAPGVALVRSLSTSTDGRLARLSATLKGDPLSDRSTDLVPRLRRVVEGSASGGTALVGGLTAQSYDTDETVRRDSALIVPLILAVVFAILVLLLRALIAPLYLIATVVLSYAFALGTSVLVFKYVFGMDATGPDLPLFAFIFLVALGVDYNIFLISRVREESARHGIEQGVIRALEKTGGVITRAGLILAGTFSVLSILPLETLLQIGFTVALGVLVDTFVVRTILVPSVAFKVGKYNWWPSKQETSARASA